MSNLSWFLLGFSVAIWIDKIVEIIIKYQSWKRKRMMKKYERDNEKCPFNEGVEDD